MDNIKNNRQGFTLVELIISMAIAAMVFQIIYSVFFVGNKSFNISKSKGFAQQEFRIIAEFINSELGKAKEVSKDKLMGQHYSLALKAGQLSRKFYDTNGNEKADEERLIGNNLSAIKFYTNKNKKGRLYVKITVEEDGKEREYGILLENLLDFNKEINEITLIHYSKYE